MGKSGAKKKKLSNPSSAATASSTDPSPSPPPNGIPVTDPSIFMKRALELKEEGNRRFQSKDYAGALHHYELGLKLLPRSHPERAVFHSNRAACLMQMRPVDHDAVAAECSLALQAQPRFPRALLRRARALEALGRNDLALQDLQALLASDPSHSDALDLSRRIRSVLSPRPDDSLSHPSPAALGASAVGSPIAGLGPCLPTRPATKKSSPLTSTPTPTPTTTVSKSLPNGLERRLSQPQAAPKPPSPSVPPQPQAAPVLGKSSSSDSRLSPITRWRPLKLVYDHDIRLAQMPVNCGFRALREIVMTRFPASKHVLIKYKDDDGDLVTITSTAELRLAESSVDRMGSEEGGGGGAKGVSRAEVDEGNVLRVLRLHIVEVSPEQEPAVPEEEEKLVEDEGLIKVDDGSSNSPSEDGKALEVGDVDSVKKEMDEEVVKEKIGKKECNHAECKEVEIDDWLFEFAQLFRTQVGIDPDAHLDLHELGMELCAEALEETVTSEDAQALFVMAAAKFQEVAALAFFNWGNVHMCAARKRIPLDETTSKDAIAAQLHGAYDWVRERYELAGQKYEEALRIKPDFYEGLLALGQQHFESAKLQWSFALANKVDFTTWDSSGTIQLFDSAEEKMKAATEMWEKVEAQRTAELKSPGTSKMEELLKKRRKHAVGVDVQEEVSPEEAAEQAAVMRSQIHLFWGNMLFERSQVEFKLGCGDWKKTLDTAVERFKLAGASEVDISVVLKNHSSNLMGMENNEAHVVNLKMDSSETDSKLENKLVVES
ncbi:LOW QUALITY PROTEIN: protein CLMP1 [Dioscorea cayenensis subsp. rotundata]|uniref:LOW QUALITY PROTEIN: protein CLMP1 n=1 Tax=Dioscorea cayennensis subsp. rotundata TaxID=55577 RepID=A0AB40CUZ8_DIOCR|nr:LOW QUALITY PROTEIN: protein CLMP1 [Dioscorea cayenensis subsp. rotundata]